MKKWSIEGEQRETALTALGASIWFRDLSPSELEAMLDLAALVSFDDGEIIVRQGDASDSFYLLLKGVVAVEMEGKSGEDKELGRVRAPFNFGEIGLLLDQPRSATIVANDSVTVLQFAGEALPRMIDAVPGFGVNLGRALAMRLTEVSRMVHLPKEFRGGRPSDETLRLLPGSFMERHRVMPLRREGNVVTIGFVDPPGEKAMAGLRQYLVGLDVESVAIDARQFDDVMSTLAGVEEWREDAGGQTAAAAAVEATPAASPKLDRLLERMVAEGASDLHLAAGRKPRWRIDGDLIVVEDATPLDANKAFELFEPILEERHRSDFENGHDTDFAYSVPTAGRFRVNLYHSLRGVDAAVRQIAKNIMPLDQLGLPAAVKKLCRHPTGLVLVTGPTGSGKSTTVASMIDVINRSRPCHILTLEDPIEYLYDDHEALVHQREIGSHATSFARALRAGMREDPDVVVVGEVRDAETMALLLETAVSGHLVFATLHTASAVLTVQLVVDFFPGNEQDQARSTLAEALRGIVSQTLLKKRAGGRVPAVELLSVNPAIAHIIREGKAGQLPNVMQSSRAAGNLLLNEELARLVKQRKVLYEEALSKAVDKRDLAKRLGKGTGSV